MTGTKTKKAKPARASVYPFDLAQNDALMELVAQLGPDATRSGAIREAVAQLCEKYGIPFPRKL